MEIKRKNGAGKARLQKLIQGIDDLQLRAGWFASARYDDPQRTPVARIAAQNEYGNPAQRIPPRPFMQPTVSAHRTEWQVKLRSGARAIAAGNETLKTVFGKMGALIRAEIRTTITQVVTPPLSPYTIMMRLHRKSDKKTIGALDKPLIDTGYMLATVESVVEKIS